jgi:aspartyl/asparaginyl-tRNA synthetase
MEKEGTSMTKKRILRTGVGIVLFSLLLFSCDRLFTTPIRKVLEDPRDYAGKTVTVSGEVTRVLNLAFIKYFKIRDTTGEITVVTEKPLPKVGSKIKVKGTVKEAFSIGDQQVVVIVEKSQS